ncbi:hypothetical protein U1839_19005 [Sphingomonas sp. RT2P30]|uniref:hypothetical protein n=1 Tax=Parasphingomonas halimpatiens TaxID=3096162 RepID=UPI002FCB42BE
MVPVARHFRDIESSELSDPQQVSILSAWDLPTGADWEELLKSSRIVILAEAGSGKTRELQERARRMSGDDKVAFFIPLEMLQDDDVPGILAMEPGLLERFEAWKNDDARHAWFFLDAVDELKLRSGSLKTTLGRVSRALGEARRRTSVILASRPSDWRPVADLECFRKYLPAPEGAAEIPPDPQTAFIAAFVDDTPEERPASVAAGERVVALLPLDKKQIRAFCEVEDVRDPEAFLRAIDSQDAWSFAARPLDLLGLIDGWKIEGVLPTRRVQHQRDAERSLRDDPDRMDANLLTGEDALEGAERIALALALTGCRTIAVPEGAAFSEQAVLDAAQILPDWTPAKLAALLRRPIFDPATYGRVRFHHRSIQEYLAASRLANLRASGLTARSLLRLCYSDLYGERVVIPSMRPIVGWLALLDDDVRNEALEREPEVLILEGDPTSLSVDARRVLLDLYGALYGKGGWRRLAMPIHELRRLANPDLAPDIRALWEQDIENEEIREFLLKLIWLGPIAECADIAEQAARSRALGSYGRTLGIRAVGATERADLARKIADDMLKDRAGWPARTVYGAIDDLYPGALTLDELGRLIRRTPEPADTVNGFRWALYSLVEDLDPRGADAIALRSRLANMIARGHDKASQRHQPVSRFSYLAPALARLCAAQLEADLDDDDLVQACIIVSRYHGRQTLGREDLDGLTQALRGSTMRQRVFEAELATNDRLLPTEDPQRRLFYTLYHGLLRQLVPGDTDWLNAAFEGAKRKKDRALYLHAILERWAADGSNIDTRTALRKLLRNPAERKIFDNQAKPGPRSLPPDEIAHLAERARQEAQEAASEEAELSKWRAWYEKAVSYPAGLFEGDEAAKTVNNLVFWLQQLGGQDSVIALVRWRLVRQTLGDAVADRFEAALRSFWRDEPPPLLSGPDSEGSMISGRRKKALTGMLIEAATGDGWARALTTDDALRAAEWGTLELNGFPEWFADLASTRPNIVQPVLEQEIRAELGPASAAPHAHVLSAVHRGPAHIQGLLAPFFRELLHAWPEPSDEETHLFNQLHNLDVVLTMLVRLELGDSDIADLCEQRFQNDPSGGTASLWLQGLCACDFERGVAVMARILGQLSASDRATHGVRWLRDLFGDRDYYRVPIVLDAPAAVLEGLAKTAYAIVRRNDDHPLREGTYSPDARDDAQGARNRIIDRLVGTSGPDAHRALRALASDPLFAHMPDRLRLLARERAALDSEPAPLSPSAFREWERRFASPAMDADELFRVVVDRLEDIEFDIRHRDFGARQWLQPISDEKQMQPVLASHLQNRQREDFQVIREDEVADNKKPDIRLVARGFAGKAVIEIKIADSWSMKQLEETVRDQLIAQYLRAPDCAVGCLWLVYAGRKKRFRDPVSGKLIRFEDVVTHLRAFADRLVAGEPRPVRIAIAPLDLRPPLDRQASTTMVRA